MPLRHSIGDSNQALNINQRLAQLSGYGAVDGGIPSRGARPFVLDFTDATVHIDGDEIDLPATSVDLSEAVHPDLPRKVVVYITPTDDDGDGPGAEYRYALGKPAKARPKGKTQFDTYEPSPPDLSHIDAAPVAEVWVGSDVQHIRRSDIKDRRLSANIKSYSIDAVIGSFDTFIDGAGVEHSDGLGSGDLEWSPEDVLEAINSYEGHATNAYHNYFSGSHSDLGDINSADHHVRYDNGRAQDAMTELDAADLGAMSATTPGQHLAILGEPGGGDGSGELVVRAGETYTVSSEIQEAYTATTIESGGVLKQQPGSVLETTGESTVDVQNVGEDAVWKDPKMAEAPVLASGSALHTGGSSTLVRIEGIRPTHYPSFELGVTTNVSSDPEWSQSYGYSTSERYRSDDDSDAVTVELQLAWDIDPGSGNNLPIRYTVYDLNARAVSSLYNDDDVVSAVSDHDLSLTSIDTSHYFTSPVRDTLPPTGSAELGDTVITTGNGDVGFGPHQFNGSSWDGPYGPGVTSLLEIDIDIAKDWNGYRLRNVGSPRDTDDAIRPADIEAHADDEIAHHEPTTSSDIDHANVTNVQPNQHHSPPSDDDIVAAIGGRLFDTPITTSRIPDSDASNVHVSVAWDETFHLVRSEFYNEDGETPSGLRLKVINLDSGTTEYESWLWVEKGSADDPLVSIEGGCDLAIRLHNDTGTEQVAGGSASYILTRG